MDIEQLVDAGRKEKGCPYYAARMAANTAQVKQFDYIVSWKVCSQLNWFH